MRKLIFALAFGAILLPSHGFALGLGEIEVSSALNQKLAARIDLLSTAPEEAESLLINLGSREEFIRAGLDRPLILTTLKFKTRTEDGNVYIDVTSPKPIRDPFLNFLLEVDWPKGHLIREYTILLDPPVFMGSRGSQAAPASGRPAMQAADSRAPVAAQSSAAVGTSVPAASAPPARTYAPAPAQAESYAAPAEHRVQAGDTAWSLANSMKPDESVSTQQMMLALLRANPEVFVNGNVNGLKRGYILRMPEAADINAVSSEEARAIVRQQNAMWREYQQSQVSDKPASAIDEDYRGSESGSAAATPSDNSRLSIVSAGAGSSAATEMKTPSEMSASELREQLALARERVETERVEKENLQEQVGSLSKQVDKMKSLLTIEDDALAEIQSVGMPSEATPSESSDTAAIDDIGEVAVDELMTESGDESEALDALIADAEKETTEPAVDDEALFVDETAEPVAETAAETATAMMDELAPTESDYVQQKETGLIDTLLDNRTLIGGLLLVVLVLGAIVYLVKRRRDNAAGAADESDDFGFGAFGASEEDALEDVADSIDAESIDQLVSDEDVKASMAEAKSEEKKFDAEATMILPSGTGTVVTSAAELQAEESDDVLAEADVYLAYGIYQQAEELLEAAIAENPDKDAYRVKLAETYYAGKNAKAFEKLGSEMKQRLGNKETPAWIKVVAMGKELCPDAEIFQQADLDVDLDVNDLMPKSPEPMDFDLGDIEDDSASELDMDFDTPLEDASEEMSFDLPSLGEEASDELEFDLSETDALEAPAEPESLDELEFDLGETDALETPAELSFDDDEEEFSLDIEASELDLEDSSETAEAGLDLDFDMSMDAESEEAAPISKAEDADSDLDMDFSLDMSEETEAAVDSEEGGEFDLSAEAADFDLSGDEDMGGMDLSEPLDADEVNTKLDLARAYLDMGDHEGARDILEEVVAGGNAGQKKEAEELMAQAN